LFNPPITIAIIEDHAVFRMGLAGYLKKTDGVKQVIEFESAEAFLEHVSTSRIDIAIVDLELPGINGHELTSLIKEKQLAGKVVMLTSYDERDAVINAFTSGADGYCTKRICDDILQVIQSILSGGIWIDAGVANYVMDVLKSPGGKQAGNANHEQWTLEDHEITILQKISEGKNNQTIAGEIHVSVHSVKGYLANIFKKLAVSDRSEAVAKSIRAGLI
jgi:DNA-binding NarL/FixJ family response regulator